MSRLCVVIAGFYLRRQEVFPLSLVLHSNLHLRCTHSAKNIFHAINDLDTTSLYNVSPKVMNSGFIRNSTYEGMLLLRALAAADNQRIVDYWQLHTKISACWLPLVLTLLLMVTVLCPVWLVLGGTITTILRWTKGTGFELLVVAREYVILYFCAVFIHSPYLRREFKT
jgi:hypothetical protein